MTHNNNIEITHPDIISICINCTNISCQYGNCKKIKDKTREIRSFKKRRRALPRCILYEYRGEKHTLKEWSAILELNYSTIINRRKSGGSPEDWFRPAGQKKGVTNAQ